MKTTLLLFVGSIALAQTPSQLPTITNIEVGSEWRNRHLILGDLAAFKFAFPETRPNLFKVTSVKDGHVAVQQDGDTASTIWLSPAEFQANFVNAKLLNLR